MQQASSTTLRPTLWRTCRILANRVRLRMLGELFQNPDQAVSMVAEKLDLPLAVASRYLREMNARGLLRARRSGRWVHYRPWADRSIRGATVLLRALEQTFTVEKQPVEVIYHQITAFTHPRRIAIVRTLGSTELSMASLRVRTGLCHRVLARHLRKLEARGFVLVDGKRCRCASPDDSLARTLLKLAREQ